MRREQSALIHAKKLHRYRIELLDMNKSFSFMYSSYVTQMLIISFRYKVKGFFRFNSNSKNLMISTFNGWDIFYRRFVVI
jgi:hypothetical protein